MTGDITPVIRRLFVPGADAVSLVGKAHRSGYAQHEAGLNVVE
jgi:hypothetical protein